MYWSKTSHYSVANIVHMRIKLNRQCVTERCASKCHAFRWSFHFQRCYRLFRRCIFFSLANLNAIFHNFMKCCVFKCQIYGVTMNFCTNLTIVHHCFFFSVCLHFARGCIFKLSVTLLSFTNLEAHAVFVSQLYGFVFVFFGHFWRSCSCILCIIKMSNIINNQE